jgi:D-alanyl-D-alanine carboxypeptidase (penicillin-binding protein 5/6)
VAGESPGKSDQQESSGETARGARDPRLTAFGEGEADGARSTVAVAEGASGAGGAGGAEDASEPTPEESSAASAEPESERPEAARDGDTPDVRESEGSESVEAEGESEPAETASGLPVRPAATPEGAAGKSDEPGESGEADKPEGSDSRLREAVAAWVASDEPDVDVDAEAESDGAEVAGADDGKPSDAPVDQRTTSLRTTDVPSDADGEDADADSGAEAVSDDASSEAPVDRKTAAFRTAKVASAPDGDESGDKAAASGEGPGASGPAKAATRAEGDEDGTDAESGAKGEDDGESRADDSPSSAPVDRKTAAFRTAKVASDAGADESGEKAASGVKGDSGAASGEGPGTSRPAKAASGAVGDEDGTDAASGDRRSAKAGSGTDDGGEKRASGDRRPAWAGGDDDGDDKSSGASIDQKTAVFRAPKVDDEKGEGAGGKGDKPVDRPTAAFGVLPEKKKGVDQPTTAIKALDGDQDKGGKGKKKSEGEKKPEGQNERTSKFVPLRSADAPAPAKASAKAPAAAPAAAPAKPGELPETERTKQQPLPPQTPDGKQPAPLDLLAQLTNTPPKPETPIRTAVRRVKIWTPLAILLVVLLGVAQAVRPLPEPALKLTADESYAFKGDKLAMPWSGEGQSAAAVEGVGSLGTSGAQKPVPIASVTKVMTAYVVLKDHPLKAGAEGPRIKIDATAAEESGSADESRASVKEGQSFTQHQLLQLLLINSSNNIARLLARWDAGSLDAFTKKMNDAAKSLGMKNTTYTDPSGLKESTKSTAADQLKLARAAMLSEAFREVVATPNTEVPGLDGKIYNNNNLLVKPGVIGIKTGSSTPAGGALMWGAVRTIDGKKQRILGVVLEQRAPTTLDASLQLAQTESYKLISTVQDALTSATVIKKGDVVGQVDDGLGGTTPVVATKDLKAVGWAGLNVDIKIGDGGKTIPHSAKAGAVVGEVTVGSGPGQVKAPVALENDLSEPSFGSKLTRIS